MDMDTRGSTTIAVSVGKPSKDLPKGGVYNRLEKLLNHRKEPWNTVLERVLDFYEDGFDDGK